MPPKKPDNSAYLQLKKDIAAGTIGRLYIFHGEEDYLRDHCLAEMKEKLIPGGMEEFNLHTIQAKEFTPQLLSETVDCLPMMSQRTLILVYDYDLFKAPEAQREQLMELFSDLPDYVCVVFIYDLIPYKADARTKLATSVKSHGSVVQFVQQEQGALVKWIKRHFQAMGKEIDSAQAEYLIFLCGGLMTSLLPEVEKIGAYAKSPKVTRADIDAVASPVLDAVVFNMTKAIAAGNFDKAAQVLGELFQTGQAPIMILSVLGRQLRQLYAARLNWEAGQGPDRLMSLCGIKFPSQADALHQSCRRFSVAWCRRAVILSAHADLSMKSSGQDNQEVLTDLLLKLSLPATVTI